MRKFLNLFLRWAIFGATLVFLSQTLFQHWQQVITLNLQQQAWLYASLALIFAIANQLWTGLVWGWILQTLKQPVPKRWAMVVFLKNAPARYLPGNVWHLYGRVRAAQHKGIALELATLSVMLEPLLVIAAALGLALLRDSYPELKSLSLALILLAIHPRILNSLWQWGSRLRGKPAEQVCVQQYPLRIVLGAVVLMALRGLTFLMVVLAFMPLPWHSLKPVVGGFGFAWLLSLVIPSPAGLGVFEASALQFLDEFITPAMLLGAVAVYRLILVLAELLAATVAYAIKETPVEV